jgi:hypothetical protein
MVAQEKTPPPSANDPPDPAKIDHVGQSRESNRHVVATTQTGSSPARDRRPLFRN